MKIKFKELNRQMKLLKLSDAGLGDMEKRPIGVAVPCHSYQVFNSVITLNPIDMMNNPVLRQFLIVGLLPKDYMFSPIFIWGSSQKDIARTFINYPPPLPTRAILTLYRFAVALLAKLGSLKFRASTKRAVIPMRGSPLQLISCFLAFIGAISELAFRHCLKGLTTNRTIPISHTFIIHIEGDFVK